MENETEIKSAIEKLAKKYNPDDDEIKRNAEIVRGWNSLCMIEFSVEHVSGKEALELVKARR